MPNKNCTSLINLLFVWFVRRLKKALLKEKILWFLSCLLWEKSRSVPWRTSVPKIKMMLWL